jgi:hypothetical protein
MLAPAGEAFAASASLKLKAPSTITGGRISVVASGKGKEHNYLALFYTTMSAKCAGTYHAEAKIQPNDLVQQESVSQKFKATVHMNIAGVVGTTIRLCGYLYPSKHAGSQPSGNWPHQKPEASAGRSITVT